MAVKWIYWLRIWEDLAHVCIVAYHLVIPSNASNVANILINITGCMGGLFFNFIFEITSRVEGQAAEYFACSLA